MPHDQLPVTVVPCIPLRSGGMRWEFPGGVVLEAVSLGPQLGDMVIIGSAVWVYGDDSAFYLKLTRS